MKRLLAYIISRINGVRIGDCRYTKASPFVVGDLCHFLPTECQTAKERSSLKYCANKEQWDGFLWVFIERVELTRDEWREILTS